MRYVTRQPKKTAGFSWSRIPAANGGVTYRLFRRDQRGALHYFMRSFNPGEAADHHHVATVLMRARHTLRDQVDEIDLQLMGVTE